MRLFLFALSIALVTYLALYGLILKPVHEQREIQSRLQALEQLGTDPFAAREQEQEVRKLTFRERVIEPFKNNIANAITRLMPQQIVQQVTMRLLWAGKAQQWSVPEFIASCLGGFAFMSLLLLFSLWGNAGYNLLQKAGIVFIAGMAGGSMPLVVLNTITQRRRQAMLNQLPSVLDLLCVSVQAGLAFDAALRQITRRMTGPLIDEFRRMQEEIRMGMVRRIAMRNFATRCQVQDVTLFITSVIQAEQLGTSMGKTLKNQADNIRERRRQRLRAQALKAPVKMIFPIAIFIFPILFVVVLLPTIFSVMKSFNP